MLKLTYKGFTAQENIDTDISKILEKNELINLTVIDVIFDRAIKSFIKIAYLKGKGRNSRIRHLIFMINDCAQKISSIGISKTDVDYQEKELLIEAMESAGLQFVGKVNKKNLDEALAMIIEHHFPYCEVKKTYYPFSLIDNG
jgi:3'-phosphoadenosine 5'-phosphosulfate sulfotransferase